MDGANISSLLGAVVTAENFVAGAQVTRSKHWCWGDNDGGQPMILVELLGFRESLDDMQSRLLSNCKAADSDTVGSATASWVLAELPGRQNSKARFRIGAQQTWDLIYGPTPEAQLQPLDPPRHLLGQLVTVENFIPNARVSRAPDFRWNDEDKAGPGILLRLNENRKGWAYARFGAATDNIYRIGDGHGAYDLIYGDEPKDLDPVDVPRELAGEDVTAENFVVGACVARGPKWSHGFEDRGKPGQLLRLEDRTAAWVRWGDKSENRYLAARGELVYGTEPMQIINSLEVTENFSFVDRWLSVDALRSGNINISNQENDNISCYSEQAFDIETADFEVCFAVRELRGRIVALGVMNDGRSIDACSRHIVGVAPLAGSVGIGIERGCAFIILNGNKMDVLKVNTSGSTLLGMKVVKGDISFTVDRKRFETSASVSVPLEHRTGVCRVVVSFTKAGQNGVFYTVQQRPRQCKSLSLIEPSSNSSSSFSPLPSPTTSPSPCSSAESSDGQLDDASTARCRLANENPPVRANDYESYLGAEWIRGRKFGFVGYTHNVDVAVTDGKRGLKCVSSKPSTLFSNEVFDFETADFEETIYFPRGVLAGDVVFGIVGENPTARDSTFLCGQLEMQHSLGLRLLPGVAALFYKEELRNLDLCDTHRSTSITMTVRKGRLDFKVNDSSFDSPFLASLNKNVQRSRSFFSFSFSYDPDKAGHLLVKRKFRLAISLSSAGQIATFDATCAGDMSSSPDPMPQIAWYRGTSFTFADYLSCISVIGDSREMVAKGSWRDGKSRGATCFSREIFDFATARFSETVTFHGGTRGGELAFGIIGAQPGASVCNHMCGDSAIPDSVGLLIRADGTVCLHHKSETSDVQLPLRAATNETMGDLTVRIDVDFGQLAFFVNGLLVTSPVLSALVAAKTLSNDAQNNDRYRLAISMTTAGQRATLPPSKIPYVVWKDGAPFTLHDAVNSIRIGESGKGAECISSRRATVYSNEVFDWSSAEFACTFTLHGGTKGGDVWFGLVNDNPTCAVAGFACGDNELHDSVGLLLRQKYAGIRHRGILFDFGSVSPENEDRTVTMKFGNGMLSFHIDGNRFDPPYLLIRAFPGKWRLAISFAREGQRVTISHADIRGPQPTGEIENVAEILKSVSNKLKHLLSI